MAAASSSEASETVEFKENSSLSANMTALFYTISNLRWFIKIVIVELIKL